jgi:hypothetical protein
MSELLGIARFKFHEGKLEEFKRLSAQAMEIVRTKACGSRYDRTLCGVNSSTSHPFITSRAGAWA